MKYTRLGEIIRCPWHGWEFDIRTGQSYCDPRRFRAKAYPVNVEPGSAVVKGPYVAETVKVAVESDYVVVDLSEPSFRGASETSEPGTSRFRVRCCASPRNDEIKHAPSSSVPARSAPARRSD